MEDSFVFIQNLVFSLLLGGLVGLEREKRRQKEDSHEFGGIRTLSLAAVFGYLVTVMFGSDPWLFGLFSAGFGALVLASYIATSYIGRSTGATTELAAFFVYLVGVLVGSDAILYASVITLVLVLLLYA